MMGKEKRDIKLLKFGAALALTLGGILFSILRAKRIIKPTQPPRPPDSSNHVNSERESTVSRSDHHPLHTTPSPRNFDSAATDMHEEELCFTKVMTDNSITDLSPSSRSNGDKKDGFLLPEFNDLVKEFDLGAKKATLSPRKDVELRKSDAESPRGYSRVERDDNEQEIKNLRNLVKILKERERTHEIQLLEYYGLKEQETAVMELQNRLKLNNMEAKLFALKIESLQADNKRLETQVADYVKVVADLEAARAKIKLLKRKLRSEAEQNKSQILALQQRVQKLQDELKKANANDPEIQLNLQKLKDLEEEVEELRKSNFSLQLEKDDLAHRLDCVQVLANSVLEDEETEKLKEESYCLRKKNEDLAKEVEQLQADRCADVEELVYLRWINACLRYELRNYQPGPGKTIARDLSKTLSPKSEEKAKQLILEYGNKEGSVSEKGINIAEFDSDQWSSSQLSFRTDSGEFDDSFMDNSSSGKTHSISHSKFFGKLMKLLRGKDSHHHHGRGSMLDRSASVEDIGTSYSDSQLNNSIVLAGSDGLRSSSQASSRHSFDHQALSRPSFDNQRSSGVQRHSDLGSSCVYKRIDSIAEGAAYSPIEDVSRAELVKYAEALKDSRGKSAKLRRRSTSSSSF